MADIDISGAVENISLSEDGARLIEVLLKNIRETVSIAESYGQLLLLHMNLNDAIALTESKTSYILFPIDLNDAVTVAENVSSPTTALNLKRGTSSISVATITGDWNFAIAYKTYDVSGIELKAIILIPGIGASTFAIKDENDSGAYLYKGSVSATTVIVYSGVKCIPYIDYSECSLSSGHSVTFLW